MLYIVVILVPTLLIPAIAAIEINVAISAYSMAVAPRVHRQSLINFSMPHSLVNASSPGPTGIAYLALVRAAKALRNVVKKQAR